MNYRSTFSIVICTILLVISGNTYSKNSLQFDSFWKWKKACDACQPSETNTTPLTPKSFETIIDRFCSQEDKGLLAAPELWVDGQSNNFFQTKDTAFAPYVQKLEVNPNTQIAFHGDIHGDVHSLNAYIEFLANQGYMDKKNPFKIAKPNFYLIFLGDYTGRGNYGVETIYTIIQLKLANPNKVFMVRGNHEDITINYKYGLFQELLNKFGAEVNFLDKVNRIYNYLPVALFVTSGTQNSQNALLCCHGGIEWGFNSCHELLNSTNPISFVALGELKRKDVINNFPEELKNHLTANCQSIHNILLKSPTNPNQLGFMWYDFSVTNQPTIEIRGRGLQCDKTLTHATLAHYSTSNCTVRGVFRAHQHGDCQMMDRILNKDPLKGPNEDKGVGKLWMEDVISHHAGRLWDDIVCTFCVCPNTVYGKQFDYTSDYFGILKTAKTFDQWKLTVHEIRT